MSSIVQCCGYVLFYKYKIINLEKPFSLILVSPIWNSEPEVCGDGRRDTCTVIMLLKELKAVADEWGRNF